MSVRERLEAVVADPVEELAVLWQWRGGQYRLSTQGLAPGMVFLSLLPQSVDRFRVVVGGVREVAVRAGWSWPAVQDAVPVLVGEGSWVFVDSGRGPDRGAVFFAEASPPGPAVRVAGSLREFFEIAWFLVEAGWWQLGWDLGLVDVVGGGSVRREAPSLSLRSELEAYRAALVAANPAWTDGLVPGRARAEVVGVLGGWVADPVEELVELWQWHDGQAEGTLSSLFKGMYFWGVDDPRLPLFRDYAHETRHIAVAEGLSWPAVEDAVPVLISPGGEAVFVDSGYSADRGCVFATVDDLAPALRVAGSLAEAVGLARLMVESGRWYFHEGLYLVDTRAAGPWF